MDRLSMEANVKDKKKNIKLQEQQKDENQREIESLGIFVFVDNLFC